MIGKMCSVRDLLKKVNVHVPTTDVPDMKTDPRYERYRMGGKMVDVESTATQFMDTLGLYPRHLQETVIKAFVDELPEVGCSIRVSNDALISNNAPVRRPFYVTMRSNSAEVVDLLITC